MRIIGGTLKGRKVSYHPKLKSRPTTDFAREGLFNVLEGLFHFSEINVLDCFSGTGIVGIEAWSRGAQSVVAGDVDIWSQRAILQTVTEFKLDHYRFHRADVFRFLKKEYPTSFDLVFADPPYSFPTSVKIPDLVCQGSWLNKGGYLVLEHGKDKKFTDHPQFDFSRSFGNVIFSFFKKE